MLFCGGSNCTKTMAVRSVRRVDDTNLKTVKGLQPMIKERRFPRAVCLKDDVYVFGGLNNNHKWLMSIERYSSSTSTWNTVGDMVEDRRYFLCMFIYG